MAAHRKHPTPAARMAQLLMETKAIIVGQGRTPTVADFELAWREAWEQMVTERAWPHATEHRRQWRVAMLATKAEARAAFVGRPTAFSRLAAGMMATAPRVQVELSHSDLPKLVIGAIRAGYQVTSDDEVPAA